MPAPLACGMSPIARALGTALSILSRHGVAVAAGAVTAVWYARRVRHAHVTVPTGDSELAQRTRRIAEGCRRMWRRYAPFIVDDGFLQTMLAFFWRPLYVRRPTPTKTQVLFTPDGGGLSLVWFEPREASPEAPVVFVSPGNLGGWFAPYLRRILRIMPRRGWRCVVFVRRGADGNDLRNPKPQLYSDTRDFELAVGEVQRHCPGAPIFGVGFSLGANYLSRFIAIKDRDGGSPFLSAVTVANPFDLVQLGYWGEIFSRGADFAMRTDVSMMIARNRHVLSAAVDVDHLLRAPSYRELCRRFHCVVHAQDDLDTMLGASSCAPLLGHVRTPLLAVNSADDPVVNPMVIPFATFGSSDCLVLALAHSGGHHGFMGWNPFTPSWLDGVILDWLESSMVEFGIPTRS